jgi:hypothetical protein
MTTNDFEQFAKAFRCSLPMAESIVVRIRQRVGRDVPIAEILGAIKKIAPTRLTTDSIVLRLQKAGATRPARSANQDDDDDLAQEPDDDEAEADDDDDKPAAPKTRKAPTTTRRPVGAQGQIREMLEHNWTKAKESGLKPPEMTADRFVRTAQSAVGEPKPTVARVLQAVQKLSKRDVLITPNLVADEIIETDELR